MFIAFIIHILKPTCIFVSLYTPHTPTLIMRFSSFFLAALPLAVLASPTAANDESLESFSIEKRNAASIQKKLNAVLADVKALDSELNSFGDSASPSGTQVIALEGDEQQLEKDLNSTKSTVDAGAKLNSADSTTIYNFLNGQLLSSTKTLLQDFIDHYP